MYTWGGDTSKWKKPGDYKFDDARKPYLDKLAADASLKGPRSYVGKREPKMELVDPKGKTISTDSKNPIIFAVDVTGSMVHWPAEIFDRLPLLDQTLTQYREDAKFCFAAIGDAFVDRFPLQVNDFASGIELEEKVKALGCEGGGGGQIKESYELFAYFMANKVVTPNATSPFLFICGDEKAYGKVDAGQVEHYIGDNLEAEVQTADVWKQVMQKFNVFFLLKPYGHGNDPDTTSDVRAYWENLLGKERVVELPKKKDNSRLADEERVVDVAMGIVARHWGQYTDFDKSLNARQTDASVRDGVHRSVYAGLRHLPDEGDTKSVIATAGDGSEVKSLLDLDK